MKYCTKCKQDKERSEYYEYDGKLVAYCKPCYRAKYKVDDTDRRRHNFRGMWLKRYQQMTVRTETGGWGPYTSNAKGKPILSKTDFLAWCQRPENLTKWKRLHKAYVASGYQPEKIVTIDRIDNGGGYTIGNMQWLSLKANSKKGTK